MSSRFKLVLISRVGRLKLIYTFGRQTLKTIAYLRLQRVTLTLKLVCISFITSVKKLWQYFYGLKFIGSFSLSCAKLRNTFQIKKLQLQEHMADSLHCISWKYKLIVNIFEIVALNPHRYSQTQGIFLYHRSSRNLCANECQERSDFEFHKCV